jgi:phosphatidylglycerol lysyltransferase
VLFVLVPRSLQISYGGLLAIYLVAQTAAVLSHVPGGVGVFEAIVMGLVVVQADTRIAAPALAASIAASLLIYRIVYYLVPLVAAIALSTVAEVIRPRVNIRELHPTAALAAASNPMATDAI